MNLVCLDLEGVLVPEIWINFAEATGIPELRLTTRDISDYDVLMKKRIGILKDHNLKLADIQKVIGGMEPLEGGKEFLDSLRSLTQVVILSDTFEEFARPLMKKLEWPTLFCNSLITDRNGTITGYSLRQTDGKRKAVEAFKSVNCRVFAAGDSYNDISMLQSADKGVFFHAPESIKKEYPAMETAASYGELMDKVKYFLSSKESH